MVCLTGEPLAGHSAPGENEGFFRVPSEIAWRMPVTTFDAYLAALNSKQRGRHRTRLQKSQDVTVSVAPITPDLFKEWYPIYDREVVGKAHGRRTLAADWITGTGKNGEFFLLQHRKPESGELLGGAVLRKMANCKQLNISYAAYSSGSADKELSFRTFVEALSTAHREGFTTLSHGRDRNLYGYYYTLGLLEFKSALGFQPSASGDMQWRKILNPAAMGGEFVYFTGDAGPLTTTFFSNVPRSLKVPAGLEFRQLPVTEA
jgi:hypothetical protein